MTQNPSLRGAVAKVTAPRSRQTPNESVRWHRSSVSMPMSRLEFDLLGKSYARGYAAALSGFTKESTKVSVRLHQGHLYSAIETTQTGGNGADIAASPIEPTMEQWCRAVKPAVMTQLHELAELVSQSPEMALRRAGELFESCTRMHHQLLLPARHVVNSFLKSTVSSRRRITQQDSLPLAILALLGVDLPLFRGGKLILQLNSPYSESSILELLEDSAPDGDGYGVAVKGWLDDVRYVRHMLAFYKRVGVTRTLIDQTAERTARRRRVAELLLRTELIPLRKEGEFNKALAEARDALKITECHGPLMHATYLHNLRNLVIAQGTSIRKSLPRATDVLHLSFSELAEGQLPCEGEILARRSDFQAACRAPLPPPELQFGADERKPEPIGWASDQYRPPDTWSGLPGSPGRADGRLVRVWRPSDIDRVSAGDIALVPDPGAVWGWLGLGVRALLVEGGHQLSHAATAARELGIPCVLNCAGLAEVAPEGRNVHVDGRKGMVRW